MRTEDAREGMKVRIKDDSHYKYTKTGSWGYIRNIESGTMNIEFHELTCSAEERAGIWLPKILGVYSEDVEKYSIIVDSKIKSIGKILKSKAYLPENYSIELIRESDTDRIEGFRKSVVPKPFRKNGIFTEDDIVGYYALNGKLAGTVAVGIKKDSATIKFLYTLPSDPNRAKIQDHLANLAMLEAYSRGFDKIFFESWDGDSSLRLLEKTGFREQDRRGHSFENGETKVILAKNVDKLILEKFREVDPKDFEKEKPKPEHKPENKSEYITDFEKLLGTRDMNPYICRSARHLSLEDYIKF